MLDINKLRERLKKFEAMLAPQSGASEGERANAEKMAKKLRSQLSMNGGTQAEYKKLVEKGKKLAEELESNMWEIAELVGQVKKDWGDLRQYADDTGINYNLVRSAYATFQAWCVDSNDKIVGRPTISFWTASSLNTVENRRQIIARKPNITNSEARDKARDAKRESSGDKGKRERRAAKAVKKKGKDEGSMETELCAILREFLSTNSYTRKLLREFNYGSRFGVHGKKRIMDELTNLRSRIDGEIAWLENVNRLG